jgi:phosphoribosylaminoimidazole-succinocarboxamide synthase
LDPTTKSDVHDEPITLHNIVERGLMNLEDFQQCRKYALALFAEGQRVAAERGLLLADTKYEFGKDSNGAITLVDEVHTCDSSRFWNLETYEARLEAGEEPERFDKDMIRVWLRAKCDPYKVEQLPPVPYELIHQVSTVYTTFYERLTGEKFKRGFPPTSIGLAALNARFKAFR